MEKKPVILFADENSLWTRAVRSELRRRGARVLGLGTSVSFSLASEIPPPDLIVVLEGLKDSSGISLESRLRDHWPRTRLLVVAPPSLGESRRASTREVIPLDRETVLGAILAALPEWRQAPLELKKSAPLILCVDDDRFYLEALARILARHGYRVATFEEPERALEALPNVQPDLAILDVMMPGMDGLDLAQELRELTHDKLPVILLTARVSDEDIAQGYQHGASYYITKPCEPSKVLNIVDYFVGDLDPDEKKFLEIEL